MSDHELEIREGTFRIVASPDDMTDGEYAGEMSGYEVTFKRGDRTYGFTSKNHGIRGRAPCTVIRAGGKWYVSFGERISARELRRKDPGPGCDLCTGSGRMLSPGGGTVPCACTYNQEDLARWRRQSER
jgi:hypothetical protein